jgi:hypothetical protein
LYIGAFVGIPRSAADNGVVVTVKANKAADPIAKMRRMSNPPSISRNNTLPLTRREAAITHHSAIGKGCGISATNPCSMKWRGGLGDWHDLQILVPNLTLNPQFRVDAGGQLKL